MGFRLFSQTKEKTNSVFQNLKFKMTIFRDLLFSAIILTTIGLSAQNQQYWPEQQKEMKPWTRWWWMGSAVDKKNIREHLIEFHKAGLGGVEITPIYGAKGEEDHFLDFLSPSYLEVLTFTIKTADSLGLGVDMVEKESLKNDLPHL